MDNIIQLLTYFSVVSMAAERLVGFCKQSPLQKYLKSQVSYQALAAVCGIVVSYTNPPEFKFIHLDQYTLAIIVGLAVSGGSGMWHDILDAMSQYSKNLKPLETK